MRRIRGTVSHFSLYFQLVGLAAEIRTVHETEDYGGVLYTALRQEANAHSTQPPRMVEAEQEALPWLRGR